MLVLVVVLGAGRWCCELAARVVETGCWRWRRLPALGAGRGAGAVSGLRMWWRQVAVLGGVACVYVYFRFFQIARLWVSYFN